MKQKEMSQQRKEQMAASLKRLMTKKNLQKITIQDIADDCNMNRYTFYYHFQDIYDLVSWTFCEDFKKLFSDRSRCSSLDEWFRCLLEYIKENEAVCKCALNSMGYVTFRNQCVNDLSDLMRSALKEVFGEQEISEQYLNFLTVFYLEAVVGVLTQWVMSEKPLPDDTLVAYMKMTLEGSLRAALEKTSR